MSLAGFIQAMPKAELHVHLEGSILPATLLELAHRNNVALPANDVAGLRALYQFTDFRRFIEVYTLIQTCLCTRDDFALIVRDFGAEMARQNVRYAEVTWTPIAAVHHRAPWADMLAGVDAGREQARHAYGVEIRWMPDAARDMGLAAAMETAELVIGARDHGMLALGLGGSESLYPPELYAAPFERARAAGLRSYPHAGELSGPESIWNALRALHADRIGHGVRCIEDPELMRYLREQDIAIDVCPTSNVCLHIYPSYAAHPLRRLYDAGVPVTLNSDDPPLFNTDLLHEYQVAHDAFGFSVDELCRLSLNAVRHSFLPTGQKERMAGEFAAEFEHLRRLHL
jgi:aminodeoxyfutalosine deaminase